MRRLPGMRRLALACCALALPLVSASACGGGTPTTNTANAAAAAGATPQPQATGGMQSADPGMGGSGTACGKATSVWIVEKAAMGKGDQYLFSPNKVTIKQGGYLSISNKSDENHTLASLPDAGLATSAVFKKETQQIQFPQAGTFTVRSEDAKHRAVLKVTVSAASGDACAAPKDTLTLSEMTGKPDKYSVKPSTLTVQQGGMVTVINKTDAQHALKCTPNAGTNADNPKLDKGESQVLMFPTAGTFTCASLQHKDAKVKVTVKAM